MCLRLFEIMANMQLFGFGERAFGIFARQQNPSVSFFKPVAASYYVGMSLLAVNIVVTFFKHLPPLCIQTAQHLI